MKKNFWLNLILNVFYLIVFLATLIFSFLIALLPIFVFRVGDIWFNELRNTNPVLSDILSWVIFCVIIIFATTLIPLFARFLFRKLLEKMFQTELEKARLGFFGK